ncbi:UDP-4-amino-4,6-dideoxy-N-acetyl-beta-L-altrosamine transaminase [Anaeromicropila populeti]|uniref:UDP-4-amino-4,6-dideoxy-N-acetyl-beta-L-altrosamine transaminase n=1 Tax=Anaeromicropila populeti TaxID=37658 RepID=A0A1I6HVM1_9FIRM|nr:UDP-4-amino-4,6-dideoxy-N-acetyl-beta-L-altrosamine transaminase [Anaeromicropila populeti]SFR58484.1 UDP-4-amino-4,6-dideoxy-N-acetyl-beta-L-altrosamine transaminase [Anaeromicropila populeti]
MFIPYGRQTIDDEDISAVVEVLKSDYLTTGPKIEEFEKVVAEYVGAKYAVAISNGTAALHAACAAAGIQSGDEVITSPITFVASANCVLYCGGTPVFADIDSETYNISLEDIRRKITNKTKAIIPVHYAGQPCNMDAIHKIAEEHNLIVIEDGAHALGAEYKGKRIGGLSDMTTFSFHPVKHITTGEGGMITTNNVQLYEKLKLFRSHGITRDEGMMRKKEGDWYYEQLSLGYNYRITDIQCALGISQMKKLDGFLKRRKEIVMGYQEAFKGMENIIVPTVAEGCESSWHLYVIQVKNCQRKKVFDSLRDAGIGVNVHYIPVYKQPYYQENGYKEVKCVQAEQLYQQMISIPLYPGLTNEQQDCVIEKVINAVKFNEI